GHFSKLGRIQGLIAIRQGLLRRGMHLHNQSGSACGDGGQGHGSDFIALTGPVAGIDDDWQMTERLYGRNYAEVESVASMVRESTDSALAEDNIVIAFGKNVFGSHEKLFEGRGHATFQQNRLAGTPGTAEQ